MKIVNASLITALLSLLLAANVSAEVKEAEFQRALNGVKWAENSTFPSGISLSALKGKSVVILVYDTEHVPSDWIAAFLTEFKAAIVDKPLVVLAINTDRKSTLDLSYMKEHNFTGSNIFHGKSSLLPAQVGLTSSYYIYIRIDPAGKFVSSDHAGKYYENVLPRFFLTRAICENDSLGSFTIIDGEMSDKLKAELWKYEFGKVPTADEMKKILYGRSDQDKALVDKACDRYLDAEIKKLNELLGGSDEDHLAAFDRAKSLFQTFGSKPQAEQLKQIGRDLEQFPPGLAKSSI